LGRDKSWQEYHAEMLADLAEPDPVDVGWLDLAAVERKAFHLVRNGYYDKAMARPTQYCHEHSNLDLESRGWLTQYAACTAFYSGKTDDARVGVPAPG